jgi:hypothetical protein
LNNQLVFCVFDKLSQRCIYCGLYDFGLSREMICLTRNPSVYGGDSQKSVQDVLGPGTELKALLAGWPFRIVATPDCKCTSRAAYMDAKGCDWCESPEGMAEIMGFLREAAEERGLPFVDIAARLLVRRAIHNARKAEARRAKEAEAAAAEGPAA